MAWSASANNR